MGSLETLPPDQRAVIDLVLQRGRSYDDIAQLLAIDRAAVRARALAAFEAIGPDTGISPESRALITDYLLGQLPDRVAEQTRERLANSPYDRAWARVLASELDQVASQPLPEIPDGSRAAASTARAAETAPGATDERASEGAREPRLRERSSRRSPRLSDRPSSVRGGAIMLGVGALVVVAVVVVLFIVFSGGSSNSHTTGTPAASGPTTTTGTTGTGTGTGTTGTGTGTGTGTSTSTTPKAQVVGQSNLNPPSGTGAAKGVGIVVKEGSAYGIVIEAAHMAPNNKNAYAAWLYNSPSDAYRLGFVNPPVGKAGTLQVGSPLPANAGHFKQLLLTVETQANPKTPGTVVLQGSFSGVPASG
jgi:Sigma-70, region 4